MRGRARTDRARRFTGSRAMSALCGFFSGEQGARSPDITPGDGLGAEMVRLFMRIFDAGKSTARSVVRAGALLAGFLGRS